MNPQTKIIAVYGSLRKNMGNHGLISHSTLLETTTVSLPYKMISLGGFPGLIKSDQNNEITIELYEVDDTTYKRVERLEGYPSFYDKHNFSLKGYEKPIEIYVLNETDKYYSKFGSTEEHISDWTKYKMK